MLRLTLNGRPSRILRPDELERSVWSLIEEQDENALAGGLDLERLSPAGVVLDRRFCASIAELALLLPSLMAETAR